MHRAAEGRGLGHEFLRHIERCAALVHVVDTASIEPGRNPVDDLEIIEGELARYGGLEDRPRLVALNKVDVPDGRDIADITRADIEAKGYRIVALDLRTVASSELAEIVRALAEIAGELEA